MDQEKLEEKVREVFEREGFRIKDGKAVKPGVELELGIYSSEEFDRKDIDFSKDRIFVDEGLDLKRDDVYVFEEEKNFDLPSFEMIGAVAVINDLAGRDEAEAVEGILANSNAETVLLKTGRLSGEYRVGSYKLLHGENTETIHKEHGNRIKVDPTKAYYSERFSTERKRVADNVEQGENVLVMFAGVGPFAFLCAEKAGKVVAVEKNPEACKYLKENIKLNKMQEIVEAFCGDVRDVVPDLESFDRVIMPLPEKAVDFLDLAVESCKPGGIIHLYGFAESFDDFEEILDSEMKEISTGYEIVDKAVCGDKSPSESRMCLDVRIEK